MGKQRRLGRGLEALLDARHDGDRASGGAGAVEVALDRLRPGRFQPRRQRSEHGLRELADSIREQGVLQPLVVRAIPADAPGEQDYEVVAGERRWQAAKLAGLSALPVVVRELDDRAALAVALIENLQREDLNPLDQARALARLRDEFALTHEQVAKAIGRSRASVSNLFRLLELPDDVKELLADGSIDMGHARALLPLDTGRQSLMARRICARSLSVRQVEEAVRELLSPPAAAPARPEIDLQTRWLQRQFAQESGQKLAIQARRGGNYTLQVGFGNLGQLQDALHRIQTLLGQVRETAGPRVRDGDVKEAGSL